MHAPFKKRKSAAYAFIGVLALINFAYAFMIGIPLPRELVASVIEAFK